MGLKITVEINFGCCSCSPIGSIGGILIQDKKVVSTNENPSKKSAFKFADVKTPRNVQIFYVYDQPDFLISALHYGLAQPFIYVNILLNETFIYSSQSISIWAEL